MVTKNSMKKANEKIISAIVLRYYKAPEKDDILAPFFKCAWCLGLSNRTGGGFLDIKGKPQQICEDCAVRRYKEENNFKTLAGARARRRRIFDVGYLFNEIVLDMYMSEKGIKDFENCVEADDIFIKATQLYSQLFSKEEKIWLEETDDQKAIESEILRRVRLAHLNTLFKN